MRSVCMFLKRATAFAGWMALMLTCIPHVESAAPVDILRGTVESGGRGLPGYKVFLHASYVDRGPRWLLLGSGVSDSSGNFEITYRHPAEGTKDQQPVLFVEAEHGSATLASAIGVGSAIPDRVVVNERTTVAAANAFAQFVHDKEIHGNLYGITNAVHMAANLASPETGAVGIVLDSSPNGTETSTLATFNSLSNVVASCVATESNCARLF